MTSDTSGVILRNGDPTSIQVEAPTVHLRISVTDCSFTKVFAFSEDEVVWKVKQEVLSNIPKELPDSLNYGLYCPASKERAGKYLDEARFLKDYSLDRPIASLDFKPKKRAVINTETINEAKLKKMNSLANQKIFLECVRKADVDKITRLTAKGFDPNFNNFDKGETPLTLATALDKPRSVMMALVGGGAFIDFRNRSSLTPIHAAARLGNKEAIRTLLDLGSSPDYKDDKGLTPLYHCVVNHTEAQCAEMLLHERADIGATDSNGLTEIHQACFNGRVQHLEKLLFYGADMNAVTLSGDTPLHICAKNSKEDCAQLLLFRGADKTLRNNARHTAAELAVLSGNQALADLINNYDRSQVVLFNELPKYNDKRRGSISFATIRNLQRSRSNPQLHLLFSDNNNWTSSLSQATAAQLMRSGFLPNGSTPAGRFGTGRVETTMQRRTTSEIFGEGPINNKSAFTNQVQLDSRWETKIMKISKRAGGYGFSLRGPSYNSANSSLSNFNPTVDSPARQYIDTVDPGGSADRAGLKANDYILEINGDNVTCLPHNQCVAILKACEETLTLKICRLKTASPSASSRTPTASHQADRMKASEVDGLAALESLDASLNDYESVEYSNLQDFESDPDEFQDEPEPDYDAEDNVIGRRQSQPSANNSQNKNNAMREVRPSLPSALQLSLKQAAMERNNRLEQNGLATSNDNTTNGSARKLPNTPTGAVKTSIPPPAPPLPSMSSSLPRPSQAGDTAARRQAMPPLVQKQLEETRKQDDSHAALMAAIQRRRHHIESTDMEETSSGIDSRVNRTKKLQVVYPGGDIGRKEILSPGPTASAGLLQPPMSFKNSVTSDNGHLNNSSDSFDSGSYDDDDFTRKAEMARQFFVQSRTSTLSRDLPNNKAVLDVPDSNGYNAEQRNGQSSPRGIPMVSPKSPPRSSQQPVLGDIAQIAAQKALERQRNDDRLRANLEDGAPSNASYQGTRSYGLDTLNSKSRGGSSTVYTSPTPKKSIETPPTNPSRNKYPIQSNGGTQTVQLNGNVSHSSDVTSNASLLVNNNYNYRLTAASKQPVNILDNNTSSENNSLRNRKTGTSSDSSGFSIGNSVIIRSAGNSTRKENTHQSASAVPKWFENTGQHSSSMAASPSSPHRMNGNTDTSVSRDFNSIGSDSFIPPPAEFASADSDAPDSYPSSGLRSVVNFKSQSNSTVFKAKLSNSDSPLGKGYQTKALENWSVADVSDWLESLNYDEYKEAFRQRKVTGRMLASAEPGELASLGVAKLVHQVKLELEIKKYRASK